MRVDFVIRLLMKRYFKFMTFGSNKLKINKILCPIRAKHGQYERLFLSPTALYSDIDLCRNLTLGLEYL